MEKKLSVVSQLELDSVWEDCAKLLQKGLLCSDGELNIDQARLFLVQGSMRLLVCHREDKIVSALLAELLHFPNYRCVNIISIGGKNLLMDAGDVKQLKKICKGWGASKIQGWTHPKMTEYLCKQGFEKKYDVVRINIEKDIE